MKEAPPLHRLTRFRHGVCGGGAAGYNGSMNPRIHSLLATIYGEDSGSAAAGRLNEIMLDHAGRISKPSHAPDTEPGKLPLSEGDSVMITFGDQFRGNEDRPLQYLRRFMEDHLEEVVRGVHILPFSPSSSDYREVNPDLGTWEDVEDIASEYRLMVDLVLDHCSAQSEWFLKFKEGEEPDTRHVWTTFSADQVDLNFADPIVLLEMVDILLDYVERGVQIVSLDAIAHPSIHHPKTHLIVQLFRAVLEELAPWVVIITESNEAHMVYNFSLPPLILDALLREDTRHLQRWATSLPEPSTSTTFFNFLASHDGIALLPATGILSQEEIDGMIDAVKERGGRISYKATSKGEIPYEMNVNYLSAVADPALPEEQRARIFLASQAIMLSLAGVPGIYVHSLIGSENWSEGVEKSAHNRAINRERLDFDAVIHDLLEEGTLRRLVFDGYKQLLEARIREPAFHPAAAQRIVEMPHQVFCVIRGGAVGAGTGSQGPPTVAPVICLMNVSADDVVCHVDLGNAGVGETKSFSDIITSDTFFPHWDGPTRISLELRPYEVMWLKPI